MGKNKKKNKLNAGHYHEAMDRAYLSADLLGTTLLDHPVFTSKKHVDWKAKVEAAQSLLADVYQEIGGYEYAFFKKNGKKRKKPKDYWVKNEKSEANN